VVFFVARPAGVERVARKPVLVYMEGSGAQSHFLRVGDRMAHGLGGLVARHVAGNYHGVLIEKRGIEFGYQGSRPGSGEGAPAEYTRFATLASRVEDVRAVLDVLLTQPVVDPRRVVLVGHSEGADVAAAVAAEDKRITHVAFLGAGGACQFFDLLTLRRKEMAAGASAAEIEAAVQQLEKDFAAVLVDPDSTSKFFYGHAYRRWSTFGLQPPVENLLASRAKLFLAHGSRDRSVPVEAFDYLVVELMRHGRKDVTVRRVPDGDHGFATPDQPDPAEAFMGIIDEVVAWADRI